MKPFGEIVFGIGVGIRILALVLTVVQTYALIGAFRYRRSGAYRLFAVAQFAAGLCWFCLLLDGSYTVSYADSVRSYPAAVNWIYQAPWALILGITLLFTAPAALSFVLTRRYLHTHLSQESVKETVDMLPVGICFSRADGAVILKNLRMDEISQAFTGKAMNDALSFMEEAQRRGEHSGEVLFVTDQGGSTTQLATEQITLDNEEYTLLLASDVTEQYRITAELKSHNKKLIDIRLRMRAFGEEAAELAMSEEILRARITVHDEVNHVLLSGKYYLDHPDAADGAQYIRTARYTNRILTREGEEPDDARRDAYGDALLVARAIGAEVTVTGEPPTEEQARELLGRAVRECAANTVKHSQGCRLNVTLHDDGKRLKAVLSDGSDGAGSFCESGGLLTLRRSVEAAGGTMQVSAEPTFTVTLEIPL